MTTAILRPNGAGDKTEIPTLVGAATHWEAVDESTPDEETSYVQNTTSSGTIDLYNLEACPAGAVISNVAVTVRSRRVITGTTLPPCYIVIKTGGLEFTSSPVYRPAPTYADHSYSWATNPDTGIAWTEADINALQAGMNIYNQYSESGQGVRVTQVYVTITYSVIGTVTTQAVINASGTTATGMGTIVDDGGGTISQHGHCWNTTGTPTTADSKTQNGTGVEGAFTSAMTGLTAGTRYYVRAYATNGAGTFYGNQVVFVANQGMIVEPVAVLEVAFGDSILAEAPTWTDLSSDLLSVGIKRGREHDLDRVEAGTAICVLKNLDGNYWRDNTAGSYTPNVKPIKLIRISAIYSGTTYRRFYGVIESWKHGWRSEWGGKVPIVTLTCVDVFKSFNRLKLYPLPGWLGGELGVGGLASQATSGQADVVIKSLADSATAGCDIELLHAGQSVCIGPVSAGSFNVGTAYQIMAVGNTDFTLVGAPSNTEGIRFTATGAGVGNGTAAEIKEISSINKNTYTLTLTSNLVHTYTAAAGYVKKFPAVLSGTRIEDVMAELGWPAALADIDAGQVILAAFVPDADGTSALEHLLDVAESEGGVIFVSGTGKVVFQDRDARLGTANGITCTGSMIDLNTAQATFSDDGSDQKYIALDPEDDDAFIYNEARVSGDAITAQIYRDLTAQASQGPRVLTRNGSLLSSIHDAFDQAYTIVERYNDSVLRVPGLVLLPDADPTNLFPKVLLYDLSTRINVELGVSPNPAILDQDYHIEGIEDKYEAGELWQTKWQLWDVNLFLIFQTAHDGYIENTGIVTYAAVHDAASGDDVQNDIAYMLLGQQGTATGWVIDRGYLEFDTSAIGASATIASAEVLLMIWSGDVGGGYFTIDNAFNLTLVPATDVVNPLILADYGDLLDDTTSYGTVAISTPAINGQWIRIALNAAGLAAINKTGTTRFGLRSSRDINSNAPALNEEEYIAVQAKTGSFKPRLAVKLNEVF